MIVAESSYEVSEPTIDRNTLFFDEGVTDLPE